MHSGSLLPYILRESTPYQHFRKPRRSWNIRKQRLCKSLLPWNSREAMAGLIAQAGNPAVPAVL
jgi:hypothetical protein